MKQQVVKPSFLLYEDIPHTTREGKVRIWSEPEVKFIKKWLGKIKRNYRKEFAVGSILLLALIPSPAKAMPRLSPPSVTSPSGMSSLPSYIKPITPIAPVQAIAVAVPSEVAPVPEPVAPPPPVAPVAAPVSSVSSSGCGDNFYANYIYMHESGCNPGSTNSIGCFGIGQDCNNIVRNRCGADYACQNAYFTSYSAKYGGWAGSYAFWLSHHWW